MAPDDDDKVVQLGAWRESQPMDRHFITCTCGSVWLKTEAFTIGVDGRPNGFAMPVTCHECGAEVNVRV